ncbi:MAG: hypothetical protein ABIR80_07575 [Opitutaceae bacterium]
MKSVFLVALALLALGATGCSTVESRPSATRGPRQVALFLTVNGSDKPTAAQLAAVQKALAPLFTTQGWVLVETASRGADTLRVDLSTIPDNPESIGIVTVLGLGLNPLSAIAARSSRSGVYYPTGIYDPYYDRSYERSTRYDRYDHTPSYSSGSGGTYTPPPSSPSTPSNPPPSYSNSGNEGRSWGSGGMRNDPPPSSPPPAPAPSPSYDSGGGRSWGAGAMRHDPPPPPPPPPAPAPVVETPPATPTT